MKTYTLRSGEVVTSRDGEWPTQYTNRTQAATSAAKVGGEVIQRGRPFYVRLGFAPASTANALNRHPLDYTTNEAPEKLRMRGEEV